MRSYELADLEAKSALSRRTISDYVSRGLLSGPSHRGRGARYAQRDLDALQVIPLLRTVMKAEYPNLNGVREFLNMLSSDELARLAQSTTDQGFEEEVRRIRVRMSLRAIVPAVPPEQLMTALNRLTAEQIRGVDRGHYQIGSLVDFESLTVAGNDEVHWALFGTSTVEVRIEKQALGDRASDTRISDASRKFAKEIESLLKVAAQ
jgi:DNA-binding transcriptional MerR regulator